MYNPSKLYVGGGGVQASWCEPWAVCLPVKNRHALHR